MEMIQKKHSTLGIVSFIIALVSIIALVVSTFYDIHVVINDGVLYGNPFMNVIYTIGMILNPIGTFIGISSIFQKNTKKVFSIIGLILNGSLTLFFVFIMLSVYQKV